jgi:sugar/nucleoside kinase (ribokinase family)
LKGRALAREAGVALAVTLSDMSMIKFCRAGLEAMLGDGVDYLFCNEEEAQVWCDTQDMDAICAQLGKMARVVCLTRSAKGCMLIQGDQRTEVPAFAVTALDTNGAGDMFAGAFLYAATHGYTLVQAAQLANLAAGQVVSQYGNRLSHSAIADVKARFIQLIA